MEDFLSRVWTAVEDESVAALGDAFCSGDVSGDEDHFGDEARVVFF